MVFPAVYFSFAISCDRDPQKILDQVSGGLELGATACG
jgi:hypothetical protein